MDMRLNKEGGFPVGEGKLAAAFENVNRKLNLILECLPLGIALSEKDVARVKEELSREETK